MSQQQRELVHRILRDAPFDLGGEPAVQRPLLDAMLTSRPLPDDVRVTDGELGGVPVVFIDILGVEPTGVILHMHGGGSPWARREGRPDCCPRSPARAACAPWQSSTASPRSTPSRRR